MTSSSTPTEGKIPLSELTLLIVDCEHKTAPTSETGYPLIRTPNIGRGRFKLADVQRVDEATYEEWTRRTCPQPGDLIMAREAPVGNVAVIKGDLTPALGQRTVLIRPDPERLDSDYLCYRLSTNALRGWMTGVSNGATVPHLNLSDIRNLPLTELPPLLEQRKIGSCLRAFDDLIENNRRRIELLEETARLLYREWFVHFRYPGHEDVPLVDSEIGPIPEGWRVTSLDQRACLSRSSITPGDYPAEMFDHFSLPAFDEKSEPEVESGESIKSNKYLIEGECVLWSKLNPRFPRTWWAAPFNGERRSVASTEFLVLAENGGWRLPFIYSVVGSELFSLTMAARSNGTSNSHQRVVPSDVMAYPILDPEDSIQERFSELVEPFLQLKSELIIQNRSLAQTRDLLLPRLVSGDLNVSDLELNLETVG